MPLFRYRITRGAETRTVDLRKSNPQGWLLQAVMEAFPEVASRRAADISRLRLEPLDGVRQSWRATLPDEPDDLRIEVAQMRR